MYVDNFIRLADAQSAVGFGANGTNTVTTNYIDLSLARDIGEGEELSVVFSPGPTFAMTGSFEGSLLAYKYPITQMNASVTCTTASPAVFTLTNHGFASGTAVYFTQGSVAITGVLPTAITGGNTYFVEVLTANTFRVHPTEANALAGGAGTAISGAGSSGTNAIFQTNFDWIARSGASLVSIVGTGAAPNIPVVAEINPRIAQLGNRYLAGYMSVSGGSVTAGTITVDIVRNIQDGRKFHASGFTVV